mmetsp:Transcript_35607/g.75815  ORF Transcript_35607/g.75815 Transcript_35607/m.75815 type:complete len:331 (-) Transcript_35607:203-1195(-)
MKKQPVLPQLRPLEERPGRERRRLVEREEEVFPLEPPVCFPNQLFGTCQICTVEDDEIYAHRPPKERLLVNWAFEEMEGFCATEGKQAGVSEYIEDLEEGDVVPGTQAMPSVPTQRETSRWRARSPGEAQDALQEELKAVILGMGDTFVQRGWDLAHLCGERYSLNGRTIKLFLFPPGAPLPYFTHIAPSVGYDVAERAARITVCDGSLRQPLLDYLMQTGQNENYDERGTENPVGVTGAGKYLDFNVPLTDDRMIAMKHAKIQAEIRLHASGNEGIRMSALQGEGGKLLGGRSPSCGPGNSRSPSRGAGESASGRSPSQPRREHSSPAA